MNCGMASRRRFFVMACAASMFGGSAAVPATALPNAGIRTAPPFTFRVVHHFGGYPHSPRAPTAALIQASDGDFYGTTTVGGRFGKGAIFRMNAAGIVQSIHSLAADEMEGSAIRAPLLEAVDGALYGVTAGRGPNGWGTIFRLWPSGRFETLHGFPAVAGDGNSPVAGLIQATDGALYGSTFNGGARDRGTVFRLNPNGGYTLVHSFARPRGEKPQGGLFQASDGRLYGTTEAGGRRGQGTIFQLRQPSAHHVVHHFADDIGTSPTAALIQASDGNLYGVASSNFPEGNGAVYRLDTDGTYSVAHLFDGGREGDDPFAPLIQARDGYLYGTTPNGGVFGNGIVFRLGLDGAFVVLHSFQRADGMLPVGGLLEAADGSIYGTTFTGGEYNDGTIFVLEPRRLP
jgi:uncharacterized repeat protein (TIGR03803 family)